jgi:hypothetical protein
MIIFHELPFSAIKKPDKQPHEKSLIFGRNGNGTHNRHVFWLDKGLNFLFENLIKNPQENEYN